MSHKGQQRLLSPVMNRFEHKSHHSKHSVAQLLVNSLYLLALNVSWTEEINRLEEEIRPKVLQAFVVTWSTAKKSYNNTWHAEIMEMRSPQETLQQLSAKSSDSHQTFLTQNILLFKWKKLNYYPLFHV